MYVNIYIYIYNLCPDGPVTRPTGQKAHAYLLAPKVRFGFATDACLRPELCTPEVGNLAICKCITSHGSNIHQCNCRVRGCVYACMRTQKYVCTHTHTHMHSKNDPCTHPPAPPAPSPAGVPPPPPPAPPLHPSMHPSIHPSMHACMHRWIDRSMEMGLSEHNIFIHIPVRSAQIESMIVAECFNDQVFPPHSPTLLPPGLSTHVFLMSATLMPYSGWTKSISHHLETMVETIYRDDSNHPKPGSLRCEMDFVACPLVLAAPRRPRRCDTRSATP